jgi:hypothetical protein
VKLDDFEEIWLADFEFYQRPGGRPGPLCLVAREWRSGRLLRLWGDEMRAYLQAPFRTDARALFVAYLASAELGCFLELGWHPPANVLDLYVAFRLETSGRPPKNGHGLLGALLHFGLPGGVSQLRKDEMRDLAARGGPYTAAERADLMSYCEMDVAALARLLPVMRPLIESPRVPQASVRARSFDHALLRGEYMKAVARMERRGVPIDTEALGTLLTGWHGVERALIADVDQDFGVYCGESFDTAAFEGYLLRNRVAWPRYKDGRLILDKQTFKDMAAVRPGLAPLHELRATLAQMREWKLSVGADGRVRCLLSDLGEKDKRGLSRMPFGYAASSLGDERL